MDRALDKMRLRFFIVFGILFLLINVNFVLGVDTNLALGSNGGVATFTWGGSHLDAYTPASNMNDGSESTFVGIGGDSGWLGYGISYDARVSFPSTDINSIEYVREAIRSPSGIERLYLNIEGSWVEINSRSGLGGKSTVIRSGTWNNVEGVRLTMSFTGTTSSGRNYHRLYELRAFGPEPIFYQDSNLKVRVDGQTISIAAEMNETDSKLKFRNNGVTYGIALIDSADFGGVDDSGVRVRIDGMNYGLRKYS